MRDVRPTFLGFAYLPQHIPGIRLEIRTHRKLASGNIQLQAAAARGFDLRLNFDDGDSHLALRSIDGMLAFARAEKHRAGYRDCECVHEAQGPAVSIGADFAPD